MPLFGSLHGWPQAFEYSVKHHHILYDCQGSLKITSDGVEFIASKSKDSRKWKFNEIRALEIKSPSKIEILTYEDQKLFAGKDKIFEFTLIAKKADASLTTFLLNHVDRPMLLSLIPPIDEKPAFELQVKHLHTVTGTQGMLRIYNDTIVYSTVTEGDSRFWRLRDIERFSQPDRYRLQIVSFLPQTGGPAENYNFQLFDDAPKELYDYLWTRLHPSSYYPAK
jgi:hypothetical protein